MSFKCQSDIDNKNSSEKFTSDTLILSGGSTTGIVMLGKLHMMILSKCLDIDKITTFGGTSIGAVICLLLVVGYQPVEIAYYLYNNDFWTCFSKIDMYRVIQGNGLFSLKILSDELEKMVLLKMPTIPKFSELKKNYLCSSFNLCQNRMAYFDNISTPDMDTVKATVMSCAIPILFEPCIYNNERFIDGGIIDNFPIAKTSIQFGSKYILGLKCCSNRMPADINTWSFGDLLAILFASSECHVASQLQSLHDAHVQIVTVVSTTPFYNLTLNKNRIGEMFASGMI